MRIVPMLRCVITCFFVLPTVGFAFGREVAIYRDAFGVPSVVTETLEDAMHGLGYAMAEDNAELMARNYRQARGRLAEVDGKGQLLTDTFLQSLGIEEMAEAKSKALASRHAALLDQFCAGANLAIDKQRGTLPPWVRHITRTDVLALAQLVNAAFPLLDVSRQLLPGFGSNQFAIAPRRSATGNAILSADPHLTWTGVMAWYEFGIFAGDTVFRGVTVNGLPFGVMGHNSRVAWCMTNNDPDLFDFYTVSVNPDNPKQYNFHGGWRDFEERTVELRYVENGETQTVSRKLRRTAWGPMAPIGTSAIRFTMIGAWDMLDQSLAMLAARSVSEFREALRPCGLSMWNVVFADIEGNIGYQFNARLPKRDERFDWTKAVPGSNARTAYGSLWTIDELPHTVNPSSGLLVNCNSAPYLTTLGDEIRAYYPRYLTGHQHTTRYDRLSALLRVDSSIRIEEAMRYATDTEVPYARKAVSAIVTAAGSAPANSLKGALAVLGRWDGRTDIGSVGAALYAYWLMEDKGNSVRAKMAHEARVWNDSDRVSALSSLESAAAKMLVRHGRLDIPWGEFHVARRGDQMFPVSGFAGIAPGIASVCPNGGTFRDGQVGCTYGSSFRMIVHLDLKGIRSWSILPFGNSHNPKGAHFSDQAKLFGEGRYKPAFAGIESIVGAARSHLKLELPE